MLTCSPTLDGHPGASSVSTSPSYSQHGSLMRRFACRRAPSQTSAHQHVVVAGMIVPQHHAPRLPPTHATITAIP